jgi:hypothetical protein
MASTKCSWMIRQLSTAGLLQRSAWCQPEERLSRLFAPVSRRSRHSCAPDRLPTLARRLTTVAADKHFSDAASPQWW